MFQGGLSRRFEIGGHHTALKRRRFFVNMVNRLSEPPIAAFKFSFRK
jgi:hypothetical protein